MNESRRMAAVQSPIIPEVAALIRRHPGTISLGQGVVHYGPPPEAQAAAARFYADPANHRYRPVDGIPELRAALEAKVRTENGIAPDGRRLLVTAGGNLAFFNAVLAIADAGDEIILPAPYYFNHEMALAMLHCRAQIVPTDAAFQLDLGRLAEAITPRTRAIVTVSPNNPTGAVYSRETLAAVNALCRQRGLYHISDEAYEYFVFGGRRHFSPASLPDSQEHTLSLFSFSKAYGMASWRVGYLVAPAHLQTALEKAQDTDLICPPVISQYAALGALEAGADFWRPRVAALAEVRALVLAELGRLDSFCTVPEAHGAFYFWLKLATSLEPLALVERLVREFGVAAIPGTTFGLAGACTLRIAYGALERETVAEGVGRLVRGLNQIVGQPRGDRRTQPVGAQPPGGAAGAPEP